MNNTKRKDAFYKTAYSQLIRVQKQNSPHKEDYSPANFRTIIVKNMAYSPDMYLYVYVYIYLTLARVPRFCQNYLTAVIPVKCVKNAFYDFLSFLVTV